MPNPQVGAQHAVGRALIRVLATDADGGDPGEIEVAVSAAGKPFLPDTTELHVSVAHTDGLVIVGRCRSSRIGVDVEPASSTSTDLHRLAERLFHVSEVAAFRDVADAEARDWFASVWTIKEAVGKALGVGMVPALSGAVVERDHGQFRLTSVWSGPPASSWTVHLLNAPGGTEKIAVALPAPAVPLASITPLNLESFMRACSATGRQPAG